MHSITLITAEFVNRSGALKNTTALWEALLMGVESLTSAYHGVRTYMMLSRLKTAYGLHWSEVD
ncbi:hypothetical protein DPV78_009621 [Talaromyces pinophilus]|jgi:hypothetical protein|nr:hypothetical protein DPV78_009621 [Talaromyces pinophilus]